MVEKVLGIMKCQPQHLIQDMQHSQQIYENKVLGDRENFLQAKKYRQVLLLKKNKSVLFTSQPHRSSPTAIDDVGKILEPHGFKLNQHFFLSSTSSNSEKLLSSSSTG